MRMSADTERERSQVGPSPLGLVASVKTAVIKIAPANGRVIRRRGDDKVNAERRMRINEEEKRNLKSRSNKDNEG